MKQFIKEDHLWLSSAYVTLPQLLTLPEVSYSLSQAKARQEIYGGTGTSQWEVLGSEQF